MLGECPPFQLHVRNGEVSSSASIGLACYRNDTRHNQPPPPIGEGPFMAAKVKPKYTLLAQGFLCSPLEKAVHVASAKLRTWKLILCSLRAYGGSRQCKRIKLKHGLNVR